MFTEDTGVREIILAKTNLVHVGKNVKCVGSGKETRK